eukprot:2977574-Pleurochrysis_carterae.AAC.2
MPSSTRAFRSSEALVMRVLLSLTSCRCSMFVQSPCASSSLSPAEPVLEGGVGDVHHKDGKGVLVASLNEVLHASIHLSGNQLIVGELLGVLTPYSRMQLVVEEDGVQLLLVEVQNDLQLALELAELNSTLVVKLQSWQQHTWSRSSPWWFDVVFRVRAARSLCSGTGAAVPA